MLLDYGKYLSKENNHPEFGPEHFGKKWLSLSQAYFRLSFKRLVSGL